MIGPFCVAKSKPWIPAKVSIPPGAPDVIPLIAIRPRLTSPPVVKTVGLPANCRELNLNPAPLVLNCVSNPLAESNAEVDPKMNAERGPSTDGPRQIFPKFVCPLVVMVGSVVIVVPLVIT